MRGSLLCCSWLLDNWFGLKFNLRQLAVSLAVDHVNTGLHGLLRCEEFKCIKHTSELLFRTLFAVFSCRKVRVYFTRFFRIRFGLEQEEWSWIILSVQYDLLHVASSVCHRIYVHFTAGDFDVVVAVIINDKINF